MKSQMAYLRSLMRFFLCICFFTTSLGWAAEDDKTLLVKQEIAFDDLAKLVSEKNENVDAARFHMKAQESRTGRLIRSVLPQISAVAGEEQFKTGSDETVSQEYWKIEASINLYRGGRDQIEDRIRDSSYSLSKKSYQAEFRNELKEARKSFWTLVSLNQLIADYKEALDNNDRNIKVARRRSGVGLTTNADAAQFELHKIYLERELAKLELEKDMAQNVLSVALALESHKTLEVTNQFPKVPESSVVVEASADKLVAVQMNKELEAIEQLKADQSSRWWLPRVDLYANHGLPSPTEEYERSLQNQKQWAAGVRLTIDLGQGFEDRRESLARQAEANSFKRKVQHAAREGRANIHDLSFHLNKLQILIQRADQDVEVARNFLKLTEGEYNRGVKNGPDLLEAIQKYYEFRERRIIYYRDYYLSKAEQDSLIVEEEVK